MAGPRRQSVGFRPLLLVVDDDVVYVLPLRILTLEGGGASFPVLRDHRRHRHHHLSALLHRGLDRVGVNALYRYAVASRQACCWIVLAVELGIVLNVCGIPVAINSLGVDLDMVLV